MLQRRLELSGKQQLLRQIQQQRQQDARLDAAAINHSIILIPLALDDWQAAAASAAAAGRSRPKHVWSLAESLDAATSIDSTLVQLHIDDRQAVFCYQVGLVSGILLVSDSDADARAGRGQEGLPCAPLPRIGVRHFHS